MDRKQEEEIKRGRYTKRRAKLWHNEKLWGTPIQTKQIKSETMQTVEKPFIKIEPLTKMETKSIFSSRTFWFGLLEIVGGVATALAGELQQGATLTIMGVVTIILRSVTKSGVRIM